VDVREEHLVEQVVARHLDEWTDVDAGRLHVDQEVREPLMLRDVRIGAREEDAVARLVRE
jgi:hypothetical protein